MARILTRLGFDRTRWRRRRRRSSGASSAMRSIDGPVENRAALINTWCGHMGDVSEDGDNLTSYNDGSYWGEFKIKLPRDAEALSSDHARAPGPDCASRARRGPLPVADEHQVQAVPEAAPGSRAVFGVRRGVLLRRQCCRRGKHGECAQHAAVCGAGVGVFLLVKSTKILLIRGKRICLYPSVYLDQHGEEDEFLKRGRPLFLNKRRYLYLEDLWINGALDYDTLALHTSRVGSD